MTVRRLSDDCPTTVRQLPDNCLTTAWWLPDDCVMTAWRLPDDCLTTAWRLPGRLPDNYLMTAWWMPDDCLTTAWWLFDDSLRQPEGCLKTFQKQLHYFQAKIFFCFAITNNKKRQDTNNKFMRLPTTATRNLKSRTMALSFCFLYSFIQI